MPSTVSKVVFSEPAGRPNSLVQFAAAAIFTGVYVHTTSGGNATGSSWLLVMVAGSLLSGLAESLPKDRRRTAGTLRLTAVLVLTGLTLSVFLAPEAVFG